MVSHVRLVIAILLTLTAMSALSLEYFQPWSPSFSNREVSQTILRRQIIELNMIVLDSSGKRFGDAEVNVTYSCDYVTEQGAILASTWPNGTTEFILDCGYRYQQHLLSLHVTVSAFGYDDYSFSDVKTFLGQTNRVTYQVQLRASYWSVHSDITLENFSLCTKGAPVTAILVGFVHVHGNLPVSSFHLFVNGTDEGLFGPPIVVTTTVPAGGALSYGILFGAEFGNQTRPIVAGATYEITIIANFQDGSSSTASTLLVAGSRTCGP